MNGLISRQAAIEAIVNTVSEIGLHDNSEVARYGATFRQHEIIDIIEGMPSADRTGEWMEDEDGYFRCSHCGKYPLYQRSHSDFCPNCGADMREREGE